MGKCTSTPLPPPPKLVQNRASSELLQEIEEHHIRSQRLSKQDKTLISNSLKTHHLFTSLFESDVKSLYNNLHFFSLNANEIIFKQGDIGKRFYIIESGKIEVIRDNVRKKVLTRGDTFGEMSLLTHQARSATLITLTETKLWGLSRSGFYCALETLYERNYDLNLNFISELSIFADFSETSKDLLTKSSIQHTYPDNYRIVCEGDEGTMLFILKSGEAIAKHAGIEKFRIKPGEIFAESVVFSQGTLINYSVYAVGQVECLSIDKQSLICSLGANFKELIFRTISKHSILADSRLKMIPEEQVNRILEKMEWIHYKEQDVVCDVACGNSVLYCICYGEFKAGDTVFEMNESFGLGNKNHKIVRKTGLVCKNDGVIGLASSDVIAEVTQMRCKQLKAQLKVAKFLTKIEFLSSLSLSKLKYLSSRVTVIDFDARQTVFEANEKSTSFFVIRKGKVEIFEKNKKVRALSVLEIFGESCLREKFRKNTARTLTSCQVVEIPARLYIDLIEPVTLKKIDSRKSLMSKFDLNQVTRISRIKSKNLEINLKASLNDYSPTFLVNVINTKKIDSKEKCREILQIKQIALNTEHPLMPKFIKSFTDQSFLYFFYEYQEIFPFSSVPKPVFTEDYTKFISSCLLLTLEYLHNKDIIYRGLNPSFIGLKTSGYAVLTTFSPAALIQPGTVKSITSRFGIYSAPEIQDCKYSKAVDLWSLGVLIYTYLYSVFPFSVEPEDSNEQIYSKCHTKTLEFPKGFNYFKAEELLKVLLSIDPKIRTNVKTVKYMKWFSSVDWQRITLESYSPAFIPTFNEGKKRKPLVSLQKYVHVRVI